MANQMLYLTPTDKYQTGEKGHVAKVYDTSCSEARLSWRTAVGRYGWVLVPEDNP